MTNLFPDPQSPFEMEHNQQEIQARVADGRLLAFKDVQGGVIYASPDQAIEAALVGGHQLTIDEVQAHHQKQMSRRWAMEAAFGPEPKDGHDD